MLEPPLEDNDVGGRAMHNLSSPKSAPWYLVPPRPIVSVEHPFIVKTMAKAVESLGGSKAVGKLAQTGAGNPEATLYLKPGDRMSKSISSGNVRTNNILLEVTVPKRTGRKRKRGSGEPYRHQDNLYHVEPPGQFLSKDAHTRETASSSLTAKYLLQSLQDNNQDYAVLPVGIIHQTHRFRELAMPDFVHSAAKGGFVQKMRDYVLPFDYETSKAFTFDLSRGPTGNTELIPPPTFTHLPVPFNYSYQQNPSMKRLVDSSGNATTVNMASVLKTHTPRIQFDIEIVPVGPSNDVPPVGSLDPTLRRLVRRLEELLKERPIWTRRAISNQISSPGFDNVGKQLFQYVAYMFVSGPWRDALIRYGTDPRIDPKYRIYQTMMFQFEAEAKEKKRQESVRKQQRGGYMERKGDDVDRRSHIFDGITVSVEGRVYQACDILDPLVQKMFATPNLRKRCHIEADGWYHNGTLAKAKVITKAKMTHIKEGKGTPRDETYAVIAQLPDIINKETRDLAVLNKNQHTAQQVEWASMVRGMAKFEREDEDTQDDGEGEERIGELADSRVKLSMEEYDILQQAGEDVEGQDILGDDDLEEEKDSSSLEDDDDEEAEDADEDLEGPDVEEDC